MQSHFRVFTGITFAVVLGACARPAPEPVPIAPQPIYNKYGDVVGCEEGGTYTPGANYENPCLPPDDGCDPQTSTSAAGLPCVPRDPQDGNDPQGGRTGGVTGQTQP